MTRKLQPKLAWSQTAVLDSVTAQRSADRRYQVMAHALTTLTAGVPAARAWMWRVDRHAIPVPDAVVLLAVGRQPHTPESAAREYRERYWHDDPFAPHRFLDRRRRVVTLADIGGPKALAATAYGREFLPASGFSHRAFMHVWHDGRLAAVVALLRTADAAPFDERELAFLHRVQPFISLAYAHAADPPVQLENGELLTTVPLGPRQAEVARLAAGGLSNVEIGRALLISPETVKRHLSTVYTRLGVRSRIELSVRLGASATGSLRPR